MENPEEFCCSAGQPYANNKKYRFYFMVIPKRYTHQRWRLYFMVLPSADTPLYNHPLPDIEQWLIEKGCEQDSSDRHFWHIKTTDWNAEISLDVDSLKVRYFRAGEGGRDIQRSFKYSLTREDLDEAIFSGP